ncbi:TPA: glycosyltransferase [Vibrio vulnificus]|nr:glycosyltransferase [Vibrio vulnificus]HDY7603462.1 glycosyltransferase family 2 protein [Vibrio vulnificus]
MKVSVIMPVFNCEDYVSIAIESILNQSFKGFEFIIVNDGSTDKTYEICQYYSSLDSRIKLISQDNQGLISSLNTAIEESIGELVVRMDGDDISHPSRLEVQVKFMDENPGVIASGTCYKLIGETKGIVNVPIKPDDCRSLLKASSCIAHPTAILRNPKGYFNNNEYYKYKYRHVEDYFLWIELSKFGELANVDQVLLDYRVHPNQITQKYNKLMIENQKSIVLSESQDDSSLIVSVLSLKEKFILDEYILSFVKSVGLLRKERYLGKYLLRVLLSILKSKIKK